MIRLRTSTAFFFGALVIASASLFALIKTEASLYRWLEPGYYTPLEVSVGSGALIQVRNDEHGDGDFGAKRGQRKHVGVDIAAPYGTTVLASRSGWARRHLYPDGYGHLVTIDHPSGAQTRYGHLSRYSIAPFEWVWKGQAIGKVGKSGNADVNGMVTHLHFEIREDGLAVDPLQRIDGVGSRE